MIDKDALRALNLHALRKLGDLYTEQLETVLYDAIVELEYVQSVENCNSGLCATPKGKHIVDLGMATLGIDDLESETWNEAREKADSR
jgi:hypothetical protein